MTRFSRLIAATGVLTLLSACAASSDKYPSLEIRDFERVTQSSDSSAQVGATLTPAPINAETAERLTQLLVEARTSHQAFLDAAPAARQKVAKARGAAIASNDWALAEVALSDLDSLRSRTAVVLGDLDVLYTEATLALIKVERIDAARDQVRDLIVVEDTALAGLRGQLSQ